MILKNTFFKLGINAVFGKTMENVRKHRKQLVTTERRKFDLVSEPSYHNANFFTENSLIIEIKKLWYLWIKLNLFRTLNTKIK